MKKNIETVTKLRTGDEVVVIAGKDIGELSKLDIIHLYEWLNKLPKQLTATQLKIGSEIIGRQGGGGRKDFAQAGGTLVDKIDESFENIKKLIN